MAWFFLKLYDFFEQNKPVFWMVVVASVGVLSLGASHIRIEEDITKFFPDDQRAEKLNYIFQNSKFAERIVMMVSMKDSTVTPEPDSLSQLTEELTAKITRELPTYVKQITSRIDDEKVLNAFTHVCDDLPFFLDEKDYHELDSLTQPLKIQEVLQANYRQLISPAGVTVKKIIAHDPLGFSFLVLRKLQQAQYDENFELYNNYVITKDHRHLIFFITPTFPPVETGNNSKLIAALNSMLDDASDQHPSMKVSYYGASAVAVDNAIQLRNDTILTVGLIIILLAAFLIAFFRKGYVPFLILIPVVFGGIFSLCFIFILKGNVSILALAAGAMILGIAVNYGVHFLAHLKHTHDIRQVIKDLVEPMTLGSLTTVLAFFCLQFTNAAVLRDVGLFAGFSLIGAALCTLIFLPHFIPAALFQRQGSFENRLERIPFTALASKRYVLVIILIATPVFFYFARQVRFDNDMNKLNFMSPETHEAQLQLNKINRSALGAVFVVATGKDLQSALRRNERIIPTLQHLKDSHQINKYSSVSAFLISDSLQQVRLRKWIQFWTPEKKDAVLKVVRQEGTRLKFSDQVFRNFNELISKKYISADAAGMNSIRTAFFGDPIIERPNVSMVVSLLNVDEAKKPAVYSQLENSSVQAFDRQMITNMFVTYVNADFNFIVMFTALLVFTSLLISYGRIELTLITFVPMFITWIWILGIMALVGIQFNIVNVMVSTFIFGLGDDYSIFIMDGLQREYKTGQKNLPSIRTAIFLSALTTIAGLGVLMFAKHPAMRSIAVISIIGIVCVFIMSQTIEPYLFQVLITRRTTKGLAPMTITGILRTLLFYCVLGIGAFILTVMGAFGRLIPVTTKPTRLAYHGLISLLARMVIYIGTQKVKKVYDNSSQVFPRSSLIIVHHTSFLDILLVVMLHPKLILQTPGWVWHSPWWGGLVRMADYFPISDGVETNISCLKQFVDEGYSIVFFHDGDGTEEVKGKSYDDAFHLAGILNLPIHPLLVHGTSEIVRKGNFYLNAGQVTLKFLPCVEPPYTNLGNTYAGRAKIEYASLASEAESPAYFHKELISNYLYKGPVLEWYMRVKLRMENDYQFFNSLLPVKGSILDLGCGYGFLSYMLQLLSTDRKIIGVDFDDAKIETARHGFLRSERLNFCQADITQFTLEKYDGIILCDVLYYLQASAQEDLLERCLTALNPSGLMIIRTVPANATTGYPVTRFREFLAIDLLHFNKSTSGLNFLTEERIRRLVAKHSLSVEIVNDEKHHSNVIFVIRKEPYH